MLTASREVVSVISRLIQITSNELQSNFATCAVEDSKRQALESKEIAETASAKEETQKLYCAVQRIEAQIGCAAQRQSSLVQIYAIAKAICLLVRVAKAQAAIFAAQVIAVMQAIMALAQLVIALAQVQLPAALIQAKIQLPT